MARLIGPDESCRVVYNAATGTATMGGFTAPIYADSGGSTPANILTLGGASISGSTVTIDSYSKIPLFQFPDGVDIVYTSVNGGPIVPLYARADDRLDNIEAALPNKADLTAVVRATGGGREGVAAITATGSARTVDLASGNVQTLTLQSNTTITLTGATASTACSLALYIVQDATGGRVITWPGAVKWPGGSDPTLTSTAGARDLVVLETLDGGTTWYGSLAGLDFK